MLAKRSILLALTLTCFAMTPVGGGLCAEMPPTNWPSAIQAVLANCQPLTSPRGTRLPLYILPISNALQGLPDDQTAAALAELSARGVGYTLSWNPSQRASSPQEGLRIPKLVRAAGLPVAIDATACIDGFFDGSPETLHVDDQDRPFADLSFDPHRKMGCPFALESRIPVIKERVDFFLRAYKQAGISIDFVFADWEIDGPLEWNDAWANSKKCARCRSHFKRLDNFREFQKQTRAIRSRLQHDTFARPVLAEFPGALVGNYGVYPGDGHRYWYDYYERAPDDAPFLTDQKARYREWAPEFKTTGYTMAMPVVYTWYPIYNWYDFADSDYRWVYNALLNGSSAGRSAKPSTPIVTFVHHATTAPPPNPDPNVKPLSPAMYQEMLWHLLLRGHDAFFLWCMPDELGEESRLVHQVYSASLAYKDFLDHGAPINFETPKTPAPVISGLRLGRRVLVRRTDFGDDRAPIHVTVGHSQIEVPSKPDPMQILELR